MEPRNEAVGLLTMARSYSDAARHLQRAVDDTELKLSHTAPVDYLYAHALELTLKGCLRHHDPDRDLVAYGHDLHCLWRACVAERVLESVTETVITGVRDHWRDHLRGARDRYAARLGADDWTEEQREDIGIWSNTEIGRFLQRRNVVETIRWLGDRHRDAGGVFRYLDTRID